MKRNKWLLGLLFFCCVAYGAIEWGNLTVKGDIFGEDQLAMGTTSPDASAIIQADSTTQGLLPPRMTEAQRDAISSPAAGLLVFNTDTAQFNQYDGAAWSVVAGSGGAGTATLFFSDRTADDTSKVEGYDDALQVPDDMTGGTATNFTVTSETTNPLEGDASYKLSKAAVDAQGEGRKFCTDVTFDARIKAGKPVYVYFEYNTSANYVSDDIKVYYSSDSSYTTPVAFVGTNAFEQNSNGLKANSNNRGQFEGLVSLGSSDTELCIGLHVDSTNASAYDILLDQIIIGFTQTNRGPPVTEWQSFTPTWGALGTGSMADTIGHYRQVGDSIEMMVWGEKDGSTGSGGGNVYVEIPNSLNIDTSKTDGTESIVVGVARTNNASSEESVFTIPSVSTRRIYFSETGANFGSGENWRMRATIPILEWRGAADSITNTQINFDEPVLKIVPSSTPNSTVDTSNNTITWSSESAEDYDTHNLHTASTGTLKAPVTGYYEYSIWVEVGPSGTVSQPWCRIWAQSDSDAGNHVTHRQEETSTSKIFYFNGVSTVYAQAGDSINVYSDCSTTMTWSSGLQGTGYSVKINPSKRGGGVRPGYTLKNTITYTSSTTWTRPEGVRAVRIKVQGGGGGGAGAVSTSAGEYSTGTGGRGGGYCEEFITLADGLGESETITVGSGGSAGTGGVGSSGSSSSFGSHCTGSGGGGGVASTASSGLRVIGGSSGASGSGGDINIAGGGTNVAWSGSFASFALSTKGGDSQLGNGGVGNVCTTGTANGSGGAGYGSGGGAGCNGSTGHSASTGGAGAAGVVIVEEYY